MTAPHNLVINYYSLAGELLYSQEYAEAVPAVGSFFHLYGTGFFRVAAVAQSTEKRAPIMHGWSVFLEHVNVEDTPFLAADPDYYATHTDD